MNPWAFCLAWAAPRCVAGHVDRRREPARCLSQPGAHTTFSGGSWVPPNTPLPPRPPADRVSAAGQRASFLLTCSESIPRRWKRCFHQIWHVLRFQIQIPHTLTLPPDPTSSFLDPAAVRNTHRIPRAAYPIPTISQLSNSISLPQYPNNVHTTHQPGQPGLTAVNQPPRASRPEVSAEHAAPALACEGGRACHLFGFVPAPPPCAHHPVEHQVQSRRVSTLPDSSFPAPQGFRRLAPAACTLCLAAPCLKRAFPARAFRHFLRSFAAAPVALKSCSCVSLICVCGLGQPLLGVWFSPVHCWKWRVRHRIKCCPVPSAGLEGLFLGSLPKRLGTRAACRVCPPLSPPITNFACSHPRAGCFDLHGTRASHPLAGFFEH